MVVVDVMMKKMILFAAACTVLLTPVAIAQKQPDISKQIFARADLNRDGEIDLAEFHKDIVNAFHALDLNRDGYIAISEIRSIPDRGRVDLLLVMLRKRDTNRDSRLSFKEVVAARMAFFEAADRNNDDRLSLAEVIGYDANIDEKVAGAEATAKAAVKASSAKKK